MPREGPLLTIAIPTYNRSVYITQLLTALAPQLAQEPRVELLISDNASPDNTQDLINCFRGKGLSCRYIRNETNIGSDANFLQCFKEAAGKYVWLVGDDDIIPSGAIDRLMSFLLSNDFDLVYLRPTEFRDEPMITYRPDVRGRHALRVKSASRFGWMVGNMFTLTTCNIINKHRLYQIVPAVNEDLLKSNLIQLAWTYPLLSNFRTGLYIYDQLIAIRATNRAGYSVSRVFGENFKQITGQLLGSHPRLIRIMNENMVSKCLPYLVLEVRQRRFGDFAPENFHAKLKPVYGHMMRYWFFIFPIAVCPLWFAELWFRFIQRVNAVWPALHLLKFYLFRQSERQVC